MSLLQSETNLKKKIERTFRNFLKNFHISAMSDDDFDDMPIQWNVPHPAVQEVTEQQFHEFEKTFLLIQSKLNDTLNQQKSIKIQYKKLKKDKSDLINEKKQVDSEIQNFIDETEDIRASLNKNQLPKQKSNNKNDLNTQQEMMEISTINSNINELKNKITKLQTKYTEEIRLWKVEKTRLSNILQEQQNEKDIMKQSIEQFKAYLNENDDSVINEEEINPMIEEKNNNNLTNHSKLSISEVSSTESPIRMNKDLISSSSITDSDTENETKNQIRFNSISKEEQIINQNLNEDNKSKEKCEIINKPLNVVANPNSRLIQALSNSPISSPGQRLNLSTTPMQMIEQQDAQQQLKYQQKQQKKSDFDEKILTDFMPSKYKLDFTYHPIGPPKTTNLLKNGRESLYENGDKFIEYKNGVKKISRKDGTKYVIFKNGDISKEFADGAVAYFFDETRAIQLTLPDQNVHTIFPNSQKEINFTNGDKYIIFPDSSTKYTKSNGDYQIRFPNGQIQNCINGNIFST